MNPEKLRRSLKTIKLLSQTPVISARSFSYPAENYSESEVHAGKINFDLVGNLFFHLAGLEAQIDPTRDADGCFPDEASQFNPHRDTPYVDNLLWLIDSMIKEHTRAKGIHIVQKQYWPQAQEGAALLSHSVDDLQKWNYSELFLSVGSDLAMLFSLSWRQLLHSIGSKFRFLFTNVELYWNFAEYRQLEEDAGFRSVFYIAPEKNEYINYNLDDADLQEEIQQLTRAGHDVGLLLAPDKPTRDEFVSRKQIMLHQLRKDQIGIRQLHYRSSDVMRDLHNKLGPSHSQCTARRDTPGFVSGISVPYQPWIGGLKTNWWELPPSITTHICAWGATKPCSSSRPSICLKVFSGRPPHPRRFWPRPEPRLLCRHPLCEKALRLRAGTTQGRPSLGPDSGRTHRLVGQTQQGDHRRERL